MTGPSRSKQKFISYLLPVFLFISILFNHVYAKVESKNVVYKLDSHLRTKIKQFPSLICGVYIKPSWIQSSPNSININGYGSFPAASLIKIPIAACLLKKIDKGEISWNKKLILRRYHWSSGAGILRTKKTGTKVTVRQAFKLMLAISDNTATNLLIDLLGGINAANYQISKLGLKNTQLVNFLGDFKGTNKTSPYDLVILLDSLLEGNILSNDSKKILRTTLLKVNNKSLIKKGLGRYTKFAHKTGTIGICVGDAGIIYLPWGKRIGIAIMVRRPFNNLQGQRIIREISNLVYEHLG